MVVIDRAVTGAAAKATLQTAMTPTVPGAGGTITVSDDSGYPTSGKFEIVVDRGEVNEESILINSRSGTTFTIGTRGYDGTVASSHTSGVAFVEEDLSARTVQLVIDHVDDVEAAPHSTKLPVGTIAGHDVTARHAFGAALGTPGTPVSIVPDAAGAAGTAAQPARADHTHAISAIVPVSIGTANAEGADASFARGQHVHAIGTGAINASGMFAAGVVDAAAIATDAVGSAEIAANAVGTAEIANAVVTLAKFAFETSTSYDPNFDLHNVTLGTGGVQYGRYYKLGSLYFGIAGFALGTGGSVSGALGFEVPVDTVDRFTGHGSATTTGWLAVGRCFQNPGGANASSGLGGYSDVAPNVASFFVTAGTSASWDSNTPFTWNADDVFQGFFAFEGTS